MNEARRVMIYAYVWWGKNGEFKVEVRIYKQPSLQDPSSQCFWFFLSFNVFLVFEQAGCQFHLLFLKVD